ncbi:hypothetical protein WJX82_001553 [Trebouxia sp. C0006]
MQLKQRCRSERLKGFWVFGPAVYCTIAAKAACVAIKLPAWWCRMGWCQLGDALPEQAPPFAGLWPSSAEECTKRVMDPDYRYIQEFKSELEEMGKTHRFVEAVVFEVLAELLDGVDGAAEDERYQRMFLQWLQPQPGVKEGNPDETYHIIESLLDVKYPACTRAEQGPHPWQMLHVDAVGTMKVVRVSDAKRGGKHFTAMLQSFLCQTAKPSSSGPAWSGMIEVDTQSTSPRSLLTHRSHWYLFAVIKDFSQDDASKKLQQNIPAWFLQRQLCKIHPVSKASPEVHMTLGDMAHRKSGLLYEDLLGVPCILILCEKGRMGNTFPHTFDCLDMRLRASENHMTRVQELGRLCRYPGTTDRLTLQTWATNVFAYVSWMGASGARRGSSEHLARLRQLVEAVADEGQEGLLKKDEVLQGQQDYATISSAVKSWQEAAASSQLFDVGGQLICFAEGKPVRLSVDSSFVADAVTPIELLDLLLNKLALSPASTVELSRLDHRLPYAVTKSSNVLSKLQSRLYEQRAERLANPEGSPSVLQGYADNMIVPTSLDAYVKPIAKLVGRDVVDFRNKVPIGKTGAYLALLQDLQSILQPEMAVALPDFDAPIQPADDEPDVPDDEERCSVTVEWDRWFKDDVDNLRWKCPHHPDMSLPAGDKGQDMPSYGAIDLAKYGKRVLLERIVRLLLAVKLSEHGWLQGEWLIPSGCLQTLVAALDWDGRMRPFLAELLQHKVLVAQQEERLTLKPEDASSSLRLKLSTELTRDVEHKTSVSSLDIVSKLSWGPVFYVPSGDKVKVASHHPYLAFQPKNMQSVSQGASRAAELNVVLMLDPSLQQRANVPDLFPSSGSSSGVRLHMTAVQLKDMHAAGVLQHENRVITAARPILSDRSIQHWIFTPSSGRASGQKQAFINWSKAGIDLKKAQDQPSVIFHPAQGPMWGGQELHISILPTAQRVSSVSMCGSNVSHGMEPLQAEGQYVYQGMWKWPPRTGVDIQSIDTGNQDVRDKAAYWRCQKDYLCIHSAAWLPTGCQRRGCVHSALQACIA